MPNIRIDNFSDDAVNVEINGKKYFIKDDEKITVQNIDKGLHNFSVCRTRDIDSEIFNSREKKESGTDKLKDGEKSQRVQLKTNFDVDLNSSKGIVTLKKTVDGYTKGGADVIFSSFGVEGTGVKIDNKSDSFSNAKAERGFLKHILKEAFFPVGICAVILMILGVFALVTNINGNTINLGGTEFTYPFSIALTAIALICSGYFIYAVAVGLKKYRKYKRK